ncbi:hypothetical protein [Anaerolinea sp.]|uniref:hypothetical protein n=1 Tax=Anaerolinea sp. TaxID=1872519 RepID=UPI002ACD8AFC|nr:hypothetical protein [Anaerolinea sp.]
MDKNDLVYTIPPDMLHYENVILLGLTDKELVFIGTVSITASFLFGVIGGILGALLTFLVVKRYDSFANRSLFSYLAGKIVVESRENRFEIPRIIPKSASDVELMTWDFKPVLGIEDFQKQ